MLDMRSRLVSGEPTSFERELAHQHVVQQHARREDVGLAGDILGNEVLARQKILRPVLGVQRRRALVRATAS